MKIWKRKPSEIQMEILIQVLLFYSFKIILKLYLNLLNHDLTKEDTENIFSKMIPLFFPFCVV